MKSGQVITAMITPMNKDGSVNYTAAVELAQRLGRMVPTEWCSAGLPAKAPL